MAGDIASRDQNNVPSLLGVSSSDGTSTVKLYADATTHRLLVDVTAGGAVIGPASSTDNAIARFDGTTGKLIQNSTVTLSDTTGVFTQTTVNGSISFSPNGTGGVGIGTASPASVLTVITGSFSGSLSNNAASAQIGRNNTQYVAIGGDAAGNYMTGVSQAGNAKFFSITSDINSTGLSLGTLSANPVSFNPGNAEAMRITSGGNLLLGTTTDSSNGKLQLATHTTSAGGIGFGTDVQLFRSGTNALTVTGADVTITTANLTLTGSGSVFAAGGLATSSGNFSSGTTINIKPGNSTALTLAQTTLNATFAGNVVMTLAKPLVIPSGTNGRAGNAVLVGGTVTVSNTSVTANTIVMLTRKTSGGTIGTAITYTVSAATSFTITSDNVLDTSTFSYLLIETA